MAIQEPDPVNDSIGDKTNCVILRDAREQRWLCFDRPEQVITATAVDQVVDKLRLIEDQVNRSGLHAAGFIAYEAAGAFDPALATRCGDGFPLLWFGLYGAPVVLDDSALQSGPAADRLDWAAGIPQHDYLAAIDRIRRYIAAGDTYQVNYTFRLKSRIVGDPWDLFRSLIRAQGPGFSAYVATDDWTICSASPELFFELDGRRIHSRPMKGTAPRGLTLDDDRAKAAGLHRCEKNRAENAMIVDMVRNDLGRIARPNTVKVSDLYRVEKYPTLWQMTTTVEAETDAGFAEILAATFPPASITGAPKARTMEIIAELETAPRRVYTGAIGMLAPGRRAQFNVAIRTVLIDRKTGDAEYGVGGGIVWDSDPQGEFEECQTKAEILFRSRPEFQLLETMLWTPEDGYDLLDRHLDRLAASAEYFSFRLDVQDVRQRLAELTEGFAQTPQRVRLLVATNGEIACEAHPFTPNAGPPLRVCLAADPVDRTDPFLYHKTTHRRVYDEARSACPGFDDVILWNRRREITESTIANVIVEIDGRQYTPPVQCGLLPGTMRAELLATGRLTERVVTVEDLAACSRVWLANSVRGVYEVKLSR